MKFHFDIILLSSCIVIDLCYALRLKSAHSAESILSSCTDGADMSYHSGNMNNTQGVVLTGNLKLYHIYLGYSDDDYKKPYINDQGTSTAGILEAFASGVSGTDYANIMKTYNAATHYTFKGNTFYNIPSNVKSLSDSDIDIYAVNAIKQMSWSIDEHSAVAVIFRGDLKYLSERAGNSAWNKNWCGYHFVFSTIER